jgi:hypothetical protein
LGMRMVTATLSSLGSVGFIERESSFTAGSAVKTVYRFVAASIRTPTVVAGIKPPCFHATMRAGEASGRDGSLHTGPHIGWPRWTMQGFQRPITVMSALQSIRNWLCLQWLRCPQTSDVASEL